KRALWALATIASALLVAFGAAYFVFGRGSGAPRTAAAPAPPPVAATTPSAPPATVDRPPASPANTQAATARPPFSASLMLRQVLESRDPQHAVNATPDAGQARIGQDAVRFSISSS